MNNDDILKLIEKFIIERGYSPSIGDIAKESKISRTAAYYHILQLKADGKITYEPKVARSIRILEAKTK